MDPRRQSDMIQFFLAKLIGSLWPVPANDRLPHDRQRSEVGRCRRVSYADPVVGNVTHVTYRTGALPRLTISGPGETNVTDQTDARAYGVSRRALLQRGAAIGVAVWAAPMIRTVPAFAHDVGTPPPDGRVEISFVAIPAGVSGGR